MKRSPQIFLTFDVEEWTLPKEYNIESKYNKNTEFARLGCIRISGLLKKYDIRATFFVTNYFAEREPQIVKLLVNAGHEVASHACTNTILADYNNEELSLMITQSTQFLSKLICEQVKGFRAPRCYINKDIIDILDELGYQYDSSIHPAIVPGHYYNWRYPLAPYFFNNYNSSKNMDKGILEIPISVIPLIRFPISWWWMRNIGNWVTHLGAKINFQNNRDVILYFHTWEYADLPYIKGLPYHLVRGCGNDFLEKLDKFINIYVNKFHFESLKVLSEECRSYDER